MFKLLAKRKQYAEGRIIGVGSGQREIKIGVVDFFPSRLSYPSKAKLIW
jgi:hypothetical protein